LERKQEVAWRKEKMEYVNVENGIQVLLQTSNVRYPREGVLSSHAYA
jgi:hypothetical protein